MKPDALYLDFFKRFLLKIIICGASGIANLSGTDTIYILQWVFLCADFCR